MPNVYALRVFNKTTRDYVTVYGTHAAGVLTQDAAVYSKYPDTDYFIERLVADTADYLGWGEEPAQDAAAQVWAEFIYTPAR